MSGKAEDMSKVDAPNYDVVKRVEVLEREVNRLKALIPFRLDALKPTPASLRGTVKSLVSIEELERSIEEAKSAPFMYEL